VNGKCAYNFGTEYHVPYFEHMQKLHPTLMKRHKNISGICHHMMFERRFCKELFDMIENVHKDAFYNVFLKTVTDVNGSGASEYEIYFNYMCYYHPEEITIRPLQWTYTNNLSISGDFDYVSCHWYIR
jgi:hypothetical protein